MILLTTARLKRGQLHKSPPYKPLLQKVGQPRGVLKAHHRRLPKSVMKDLPTAMALKGVLKDLLAAMPSKGVPKTLQLSLKRGILKTLQLSIKRGIMKDIPTTMPPEGV